MLELRTDYSCTDQDEAVMSAHNRIRQIDVEHSTAQRLPVITVHRACGSKRQYKDTCHGSRRRIEQIVETAADRKCALVCQVYPDELWLAVLMP